MKKIVFIILVAVTFYSTAQTSGKYSIDNIDINTEYSDYGTAFYKNKQVVFSSLKKRTIMSYVIKNIGDPEKQYYDLYSAQMDIDNQLIDKAQLNSNKNSKFHDADLVFTKDFKTVYFTRDNYTNAELNRASDGVAYLALFKADVSEEGTWTNIEPLPFNSTEYSTGHPALSNDNKKLYFISDMPGSLGKTDIYSVDILDNNTYSTPVNLEELNTPKREMFPFMSKDNILYFSSNGRNGLGGLDIYASNFETTVPSEPVHLVSPLNGKRDDFALIIDSEKKTGYFSSNRSGGKGNDDIYSFTEETPIVFDCNQYIVAKIIDAKTTQPLEGATLYVFHNGKMEDEVVLDKEATYKMDVDCKEEFSFKVKMDGYNPTEEALTTSERPEYTNELEIGLTPIPKPEVIVKEVPKIYLGPIYFNFDKYAIRKSIDADEELDRIIAIMQSYPEMIVAIESHTDSRGDALYNDFLSQNRAQQTKDYMVKKGIAENRIVGVKGLGESQLTNQCNGTVKCKEEEHQMNRRTMFEIVNPESYQK